MERNSNLEQITLEYSGEGTFSEALQVADNAKLRLPTPYEAIAYGRNNFEESHPKNMWTRAVGITQHGGGIDSELCNKGKTITLQVGIYCLNETEHSKIIRKMIETGKYEFPVDPNCEISRARAEISEKVAYVGLKANTTDNNKAFFISLFRDLAKNCIRYFTNDEGPYIPHTSLQEVSKDIGTPRVIPVTLNATAKDNILRFHDEKTNSETKKRERPNTIASIYLVKN